MLPREGEWGAFANLGWKGAQGSAGDLDIERATLNAKKVKKIRK